MNTTTISTEIISNLWIGASRYFCGRQTAMVHTFCDSLIDEINNIPLPVLAIIKADLTTAITDDDRDRKAERECRTLGDDHDRAKWLRVFVVVTEKLSEIARSQDTDNMATKPLYHQRLETEADELNQKLDKLDTFIKLSPEFQDLDGEDQRHLREQKIFMEMYEAVLSTRLAKLDVAFKEQNSDAN